MTDIDLRVEAVTTEQLFLITPTLVAVGDDHVYMRSFKAQFVVPRVCVYVCVCST